MNKLYPVICIKSDICSTLTVNKKYDVTIISTSVADNSITGYSVENDNGDNVCYVYNLFIPLKNYRRERLKEILK